MGDILIAACPCGYESETLFVGCGFSGRFFVPALCRSCHQYDTVEPSRQRLRCRTCRRKPDVVAEIEDDGCPPEGQAFECPSCGARTAVFQNVACGIEGRARSPIPALSCFTAGRQNGQMFGDGLFNQAGHFFTRGALPV